MLFLSVLTLSVSHSFDSSPKGGALGSHINPAVLMGSNRIGWIFLKFSCIIRIVWEVLL